MLLWLVICWRSFFFLLYRAILLCEWAASPPHTRRLLASDMRTRAVCQLAMTRRVNAASPPARQRVNVA